MSPTRGAPLLLAVALALLLAGCGGSNQDLHAFVARVRAQRVTHIPPIPKMTSYVAFTYKQAGRRDPFVPEESTAREVPASHASTGLHPDFKRPRQPLEQYPLDSLHMLGTLTFGGTVYALVSAPDGIVHRVTAGQYMGQHFGRIVAITSNTVALSEIVPDGFGGWKHRTAKLSLAE
ncbi:MAG TPA: pilus assembly protein PilP [Nevskiaceae bacterium]|nr:pilus assembly protein PilP [Nevskiaceae bacterium]